METLFQKPSVEKQREKAPDFFNLYAKEKFGVPDGWRWVELDCAQESCPDGMIKVSGSVRGEKGTEKVLWINGAGFKAWQIEHAAAQDKCWMCWGSGETVASFGVRGTTYRQCSECQGTGKPR